MHAMLISRYGCGSCVVVHCLVSTDATVDRCKMGRRPVEPVSETAISHGSGITYNGRQKKSQGMEVYSTSLHGRQQRHVSHGMMFFMTSCSVFWMFFIIIIADHPLCKCHTVRRPHIFGPVEAQVQTTTAWHGPPSLHPPFPLSLSISSKENKTTITFAVMIWKVFVCYDCS